MRHSFNVEIAKLVGVDCATVLNYIEIACKKKRKSNFFEDKYWVEISLPKFETLLPYFTQRQIRYAIEKLKNSGLLLSKTLNFTNSNFYTISDKAVEIINKTDDKILEEKFNDLQDGMTKLSGGVTKLSRGVTKLSGVMKYIYNIKYINSLSCNYIVNCNLIYEREFMRAPSLNDVKKFSKELGYPFIAKKFFDYYSLSNWLDKDGNPFNWKQKLLSWINSESSPGNFIIMPGENKSNFSQRKIDSQELNGLWTNIDEIKI